MAMTKKRIELIRIFQLVSISALVLLTFIVVFLHISIRSVEFKRRSEKIRADYMSEQKSLIKHEVMLVVDMINGRIAQEEKNARKLIERQVADACTMAEKIYRQNKGFRSNTEIQNMVIDILEGFHLERGRNRYFIVDQVGNRILSTDWLREVPEKETENLIEFIQQSGEGFYNTGMSTPEDGGDEKISYAKLFKPFNWVIGIGENKEHIRARIKSELLETISKIRFGEDGYIFVTDIDGDALVANGGIVVGEQKLWDVFSKNPAAVKAIFMQERDAALKPEGGYISYSLCKITSPDIESPKTSFIYGIPELKWMVGAGVYLDTVETWIANLQATHDQHQRKIVQSIILSACLIIFLILLAFYFISVRLKKDLGTFVCFFERAAQDNREIDSSQIYFEGFSRIAENVNKMLRDKKAVLEKMRESEEKYRDFFDTSMVGFFRSRLSDGLFLDVNKKIAKVLGCEVENIVGKMKAEDLFKNVESRHKLIEKLKQEGKVTDFEEELLLPNGQEFFCSISVKAYLDKGYMEGIAIDITERKQTEKLLKESEERFREMAELLPEAVFECDMNSILTYANQRALTLFGYTQEEFIQGLSTTDMFIPSERERVKKNVIARFSGHYRDHVEYISQKKDGTAFPTLFHVTPIIREGVPCGLRGVIVDLTERKEVEEEILKLHKLESVGVLAGGIAHDFNNLLSGLFGNIEMAKRSLSADHKSYKYLESAGMSMERATGLTQQLLTFAKGGDPIKEVLSIEELIEETATFSLRGSNVKLNLNIAENLWFVDADKGQLSQVISNLVINGKQAMPEGGVITISAENIITAAGQQVQICVQDQGGGIALQHLDKIFDPYFSTKQRGSGLGLASCFSIITKHNGTIRATSEPNSGTRFTITLPAVVASVVESEAAEEPQAASCSTAAYILMLEDEELVQQMSGAMLEEMGHQVEYAAHGLEAVEMWQNARESGNPYDIVICDLTIPGGMGGQDAASEILTTDPQAKLIVCSGYATDSVMANYTDYGFKGRIAKPYRFSELQKEVERVLDI